jgi:anti-sigma factor RsiW
MSDCTNLDMRDLIPDFARGALTGPPLAALERHLATCASCRTELALVQNAQRVLSVAPPVNTSRIAAAVVRASVRQRMPSVSPSSKRVWLAAASIVAVAGAAALALSVVRRPDVRDVPPVVAEVERPAAPGPIAPESAATPVRSTPRSPVRAEIVIADGVSDLADAELESLLRVLDRLDGQLDVEPTMPPPLLEGEV